VVKIRDRGPGSLFGRRARARKLAGGASTDGFWWFAAAVTEVTAASSNEQHPAAGSTQAKARRPATVCNRLQHAGPGSGRRPGRGGWWIVDTLLDRDTIGITGIGMEKA